MNIYIFKNEQQYGPYTVEQLREFVQQGHFTLEDYACGDGQNWIPLSQVPGFAGGGQAQATQPQPAQAQVPQVGAQVPQAQVAGATGGASKKKKIILFSSIGVGCLAAIITMLIIFLGGDEEKGDQVADKGKQGTSSNQENEQGGDDKGGSPGTDDKDKETEQPSGEKVASLADVPLAERLAPGTFAVAFIDNGKILEKGGEQVVDLVLQGIGTKKDREIFGAVLRDPSTIGWDSSKPMQVALLRNPNDENSDKPIFCIAAKLNEADKLKSFLALAGDALKAPEYKNGYDWYLPINTQACLAVAEDFFVILGHPQNREGIDDFIAEVDRFVHSDGAGSLFQTNESFKAFTEQKHDAAIWVNGKELAELPSEEQLPEDLISLFEAGSALITLDFENGEAILAGELQVPEGFDRFGNGGLSDDALNLIPAKALAVLSLSLDMKAVVDYLEKVVLPAAGDPVSLDEVIPQLGIKPRDVLETFTGEISVALTEFSMSGAGLVPNEDLPTKSDSTPAETEEDPFGGDEQPPAEVDPFGGSPAPQPAPGQGNPGGPEGGPPAGGPGLPVEFIAALSVDPANWEKLKAAPPLTMAMGIAMLQGISVTVKDDRLLIASKKHMAEAMEGSVKNKLSGSEQSLFKDNDFALKLDIAEAAKLEGIPLPPPLMDNLKKFSYLAITGKSHEKGSSGALRIGFADKQTNSLKSLVELAPMLQGMMLGGGDAVSPGLPDEGGF